jgi:hypothetical protein
MICDNCITNWGDVKKRKKGTYKGKNVCDTCNLKEKDKGIKVFLPRRSIK